jgi:hypothetical protein
MAPDGFVLLQRSRRLFAKVNELLPDVLSRVERFRRWVTVCLPLLAWLARVPHACPDFRTSVTTDPSAIAVDAKTPRPPPALVDCLTSTQSCMQSTSASVGCITWCLSTSRASRNINSRSSSLAYRAPSTCGNKSLSVAADPEP